MRKTKRFKKGAKGLLLVTAVGVMGISYVSQTHAATWKPRSVSVIKADLKAFNSIEKGFYFVKQGDTYSTIARALQSIGIQVTSEQLANMNHASNINVLEVGTKLVFSVNGNQVTVQWQRRDTVVQKNNTASSSITLGKSGPAAVKQTAPVFSDSKKQTPENKIDSNYQKTNETKKVTPEQKPAPRYYRIQIYSDFGTPAPFMGMKGVELMKRSEAEVQAALVLEEQLKADQSDTTNQISKTTTTTTTDAVQQTVVPDAEASE